MVETQRWRLNYDALVAASVGAGLSLGLGFTARYDHFPLPGKKDFDTATTVSLIYGFSDVPKPPPDAPAVCAPTDTPPPPPPSSPVTGLPLPGPPPPPPAPPVDSTPPPPPSPPPPTDAPTAPAPAPAAN